MLYLLSRILNIYDDDIIALNYIHHFEFKFVALNLYSFIVFASSANAIDRIIVA